MMAVNKSKKLHANGFQGNCYLELKKTKFSNSQDNIIKKRLNYFENLFIKVITKVCQRSQQALQMTKIEIFPVKQLLPTESIQCLEMLKLPTH